MNPQQAIQILGQLGITDETLPIVAKAVMALVDAGMVEGRPPANAMLTRRGGVHRLAGGGMGPAIPRPSAPEPFGAFESDNPALGDPNRPRKPARYP